MTDGKNQNRSQSYSDEPEINLLNVSEEKIEETNQESLDKKLKDNPDVLPSMEQSNVSEVSSKAEQTTDSSLDELQSDEAWTPILINGLYEVEMSIFYSPKQFYLQTNSEW